MAWHGLFIIKKTGIGLNGALRKINTVRAFRKHAIRFIKTNMTVTSNAKQLQIAKSLLSKVYKNHMASGMLYDSIKDMKTIGIIKEDPENKTVELAVPVGLIMGILQAASTHKTADLTPQAV